MSNPTVVSNASRGSLTKWRPEHEELLFNLLIRPEFRPVGGQFDAVMASKREVLWEPVLREFMSRLPALNSTLQPRRGVLPRDTFDWNSLKRKWDSWGGRYNEAKKKFGISNRPRKGETGSEAPGEIPEDKMAQANEFFNLFAQLHAHFGLASRFRDDLTTESMSSFKPRNPAAGDASRIVLLDISFGRCKHSV
jgi:hypothetical protein